MERYDTTQIYKAFADVFAMVRSNDDGDIGKAAEIMQELFEKQIPKMPRYIRGTLDDVCPRCKNSLVLRHKDKYCADCGQVLDWSAEK